MIEKERAVSPKATYVSLVDDEVDEEGGPHHRRFDLRWGQSSLREFPEQQKGNS